MGTKDRAAASLRPGHARSTAAGDSDPNPLFRIESSVLCVDFDGTLTPTDSLYECLVLAVRLQPSVVFRIPLWLLRGRAYVKTRLIAIAADALRPDLFPRRQAVLDLIEYARSQGRKIELVSAAHHALLERSGDTPAFDAFFGSHDGVNLKGATKAKFLAERHPEGFAYIGDSAADIHVWQAARERFGVALSPSVRRRLKRADIEIEELAPRRHWLRALIREMRPHQWVKNLLVFVSVGLDLHNVNGAVLGRFFETFIAFCLMTSGTYIINDLTDLASDRLHPRKRNRPLASGALPIAIAIPAAFLLMAGGLLAAFAANLHIAASLLVYLGLTLAYSFGLKRISIVDVLAIATLFTTRIVAGAFAYQTPASRWIVVFSLFFFTSLALMKRTAETASLGAAGAKEIAGRGYRSSDYAYLVAMGISFGVGAVIVFSLYVSEMVNAQGQYNSPEVLWVAAGVLGYWMMRMWMSTTRGEMNDDPILYALRDKVSLGLGLVIFLVAVLAQIV
jgi:4-hydroxybenzoate polyprenyltransferase/phosphoserine phosphatase